MGYPTENVLASAAVSPAASQGTVIEQSRAVAEVQAQVVVAQQCPRDEDRAVSQMKAACSRRALAEKAFFSFPRAGGTVKGASIHLARELARCWGNMQYSVSELRRDDDAGVSEMQATAWDVEHNTRSSAVFIVPHRRDTKAGTSAIRDMRDIYENNANNGARRVREAIFSVLPIWFVEEAQEVCRRALNAGNAEQQRDRRDEVIRQYSLGGVTVPQLEQHLGRKRMAWMPEDVTDLEILLASLKRREITKEEAFPPAPITLDEIAASTAPAPAPPPIQRAAEPPSVDPAEFMPEPEWPEPAPVGGKS